MGEIKSTLDLVMERTRHLSMSTEEKIRQQREEFTRRLHGVLQQFGDGALSIEKLRERISGLQSEFDVADQALLLQTVFSRIDPDSENAALLNLLRRMDPAISERINSILGEHHKTLTSLLDEVHGRELDRLAREWGICGSAVMPNPNRDIVYKERVEALRRQTRQRIEAIESANHG
jgi:hypothetical protein